MKFNADTIKILQNAAGINQGIVFQAGNELKTINPAKSVMAKATVSNTFPSEFAIYDLNRFLGVLSLFEDPEVEILDKFAKIVNGKNSVKYFFADAKMVVTPPSKSVVVTGDIKFTLPEADLESIRKAKKVLSVPDVAVVGEAGKLKIKALDAKEGTNDEFSLEIGETDLTFKAIFKWENLQHVLPGTYDVVISDKGIGHFKKDNLEYYVAVDTDSE